MEDTLSQFMQASMEYQKRTEFSILNLAKQVRQLSKSLSEQRNEQTSTSIQPNSMNLCNANLDEFEVDEVENLDLEEDEVEVLK